MPLELRLAARAVARRPRQPIVAALTLAIAVGAVGLAFAAVYGVVIRPLVYRDASRIVVIRDAADLLSANSVDALRSAASLEPLGAFSETQPRLRDGDRTRRIAVTGVELPFFTVLGVSPQRGRAFVSDDYVESASLPVVVSHAFAAGWRRPGELLGASVFLDGEARTIVGVMLGVVALAASAPAMRAAGVNPAITLRAE